MIPNRRPSLDRRDLLATLRPGPARAEFEDAVAHRAGAAHGLAFAYARSGFFALFKAMDLRGAEVIVPAYTSDTMPDVIAATGNVPVFVDIDLADYNMDLDAVEASITENTRVIVATHMFGYPADIEAIRECAGDRQITIIEDGAWTFPGSTRGPGGLRSDAGLFSFGPGKPLYSVFGGVVVTNSTALYGKLKIYRDSEMSRLTAREWAKRWVRLWLRCVLNWDFAFGAAKRLTFMRHSDDGPAPRRPRSGGPAQTSSGALPGDLATRFADFQARLGITQLRKSEVLMDRRRTVAEIYERVLQDVPGLVPAPLVEGACYGLYSARVKGRDERVFIQKMRQKGIDAASTFSYAVPGLARFRAVARGRYPMAERAAREIVNLPISSDLSDEQILHVAACVRRVMAPASGPRDALLQSRR